MLEYMYAPRTEKRNKGDINQNREAVILSRREKEKREKVRIGF